MHYLQSLKDVLVWQLFLSMLLKSLTTSGFCWPWQVSLPFAVLRYIIILKIVQVFSRLTSWTMSNMVWFLSIWFKRFVLCDPQPYYQVVIITHICTMSLHSCTTTVKWNVIDITLYSQDCRLHSPNGYFNYVVCSALIVWAVLNSWACH